MSDRLKPKQISLTDTDQAFKLHLMFRFTLQSMSLLRGGGKKPHVWTSTASFIKLSGVQQLSYVHEVDQCDWS